MKAGYASIVVSAVVLSSAPSFAHDTWIVSSPPVVRSGGALVLHVTSGMAFPLFDTAPEPSRIERAAWRLGDKKGTFTSFEKEDSSLAVKGRVSTDGVAVVYVEFNPKSIDLAPDEVKEYMDEIGAPESVRRAWEQAGPDAKFHETFTKHAKTYVKIGDGGDAKGCLGPVGFAIDFLPERAPASLKVGDTLAIKVIRGGKEMESFSVGTVCAATGKTTLQRTSRSGMVAIPIDKTGWWLVRGTELRRNADGTWESDFTTMTFYIAE